LEGEAEGIFTVGSKCLLLAHSGRRGLRSYNTWCGERIAQYNVGHRTKGPPYKNMGSRVAYGDAESFFVFASHLLLFGSNVFMTTAWYWQLRYKEVPIFSVILISWGLAFVEYCLAVPANRFGSAVFSPAQLKTIQEVITLLVFAIFSALYLKSPLTWAQAFGFLLIATGAFFVFHGQQ